MGIYAPDWDRLYLAAWQSRRFAYAPYSHFLVGAALQTTDDLIITGCNVENASLGLTICAERNAIFKAVSLYNSIVIAAMCVVLIGGDEPGGSPCGACRQVIWEFCGGNTGVLIMMADPANEGRRITSIGELLPDAFVLK